MGAPLRQGTLTVTSADSCSEAVRRPAFHTVFDTSRRIHPSRPCETWRLAHISIAPSPNDCFDKSSLPWWFEEATGPVVTTVQGATIHLCYLSMSCAEVCRLSTAAFNSLNAAHM